MPGMIRYGKHKRDACGIVSRFAKQNDRSGINQHESMRLASSRNQHDTVSRRGSVQEYPTHNRHASGHAGRTTHTRAYRKHDNNRHDHGTIRLLGVRTPGIRQPGIRQSENKQNDRSL